MTIYDYINYIPMHESEKLQKSASVNDIFISHLCSIHGSGHVHPINVLFWMYLNLPINRGTQKTCKWLNELGLFHQTRDSSIHCHFYGMPTGRVFFRAPGQTPSSIRICSLYWYQTYIKITHLYMHIKLQTSRGTCIFHSDNFCKSVFIEKSPFWFRYA